MTYNPKMPPKRQYPAFYEKAIPLLLIIIFIAIVVLLVVSMVVASGLFAGI